jgi:1-acyl-sn-glycerol-3-phosphate acyltransferase
VLLAGNHDSYWDPVTIGIAGMPVRPIRALAKDSLWKPGLGKVLDGMGQIPIARGRGDTGAMDRAIEELRAGACIGIFPEGTRSLGRELRARSGFGRLAEAVPEARIVLVTVEGAADIMRLGTRPDIRVRFFPPVRGERVAGESAKELPVRLLEELRGYVPVRPAGRKTRAELP